MAYVHKGSSQISIGQKVITSLRTAGEVAGALKTAYEVGKGIYSVGRVVAPIVAALI